MISAVYNTIIIALKLRLQWRYIIYVGALAFALCVMLSAEIMLGTAQVYVALFLAP